MFVDFTGLKEVSKFIKHLLMTTNIDLMPGCQVRPYPKLRAKGTKAMDIFDFERVEWVSKKCFTFLFWLLGVGNANLCARSISNNFLTYKNIKFLRSICITIK